jgi:t-SNARE complex subunit (syntaxin)
MRALAMDEEERLNSTVNTFITMEKNLRETTRHIDEYMESNKAARLSKYYIKLKLCHNLFIIHA